MQILKNIDNRFKIKSSSGEYKNFDGIRITKTEKVIKFKTKDGKIIKTTLDHLFLDENYNFVRASRLNLKDGIKNSYGDISIITEKEEKESPHLMYDILQVEGDNTYITNDLISHNCSFMGSSDTLLSSAALANLSAKTPILKLDNLSQYEAPKADNLYALVADVSRGKGLDYSAFSIFNITQMPYKQVCVFRSNQITPLDYATIIHNFARQYNEAMVLVEINDIGGQVSDAIYMDYGYENLVSTKSKGRAGKSISGGFGRNIDRGIRTSEKVKVIGCSILKLLIEQQQLLINDYHTINELKRFSKKGTSYAAEPGANDDLAMTLVLFAWMADQGYFKEITNINTLGNLRDNSDEDIDNMMLPFFFISNSDPGDDYWQPVG